MEDSLPGIISDHFVRSATTGTDYFIAKGRTTNFTVDMDSVRKTLHSLHQYANTNVKELPTGAFNDFNAIMAVAGKVYDTAMYDNFLTEVRAAFADVKDFKIGDVTSFMIGCFRESKFPGQHSCAPTCAGSLPPAMSTPGWSPCSYHSLVYSKAKGFESINNVTSDTAHITVTDRDFSGFTDSEIKFLSDKGITKAKLIGIDAAGQYKPFTDFVMVSNLPRARALVKSAEPRATTTTTSNSAAIALIIILLIIIIIVVALVINSNRR